MQLVPSLMVMKGQTVRLTQGDFASAKVYDENPLDYAKKFEDHGINRIQLIDLDGAIKGTPVNYHTLSVISAYTDLKVNFSGGVHTDGDMNQVFEHGGDSVTASTVSVYSPELFNNWIVSYGRNKICLGADFVDNTLRIGGWQKNTKITPIDHIRTFYERGLKFVKTTDISRDGTLVGPWFDFYEEVVKTFPGICVYASGGVRNMDDFKRLRDIGVYGVVFGKAYFEGKISLPEIAQFMANEKND